MQHQAQLVRHKLDLPKRLLRLRFRWRHHHEIVSISDQYPERPALLRPEPIQQVQVDVGQQREITPPCGVPASVSLTVPSSITPAFSHFRINFKALRSEIRSPTSTI